MIYQTLCGSFEIFSHYQYPSNFQTFKITLKTEEEKNSNFSNKETRQDQAPF